jgi:hypothetical protein
MGNKGQLPEEISQTLLTIRIKKIWFKYTPRTLLSQTRRDASLGLYPFIYVIKSPIYLVRKSL